MQASGFVPRELEPVLPTPRVLAAPPPLRQIRHQRSHSSSASHFDVRYPHQGAEGPRQPKVGLEYRGRRTCEFSRARGAGGGIDCQNLFQMRPAGLSTADRGQIVMRNWAGYKDSVRRIDNELTRRSLVDSCPDLHALAGV
mmetsp:Transcript_121754/g.190197  ORF Transcript_121754/g.190197 Transcript_121754/m.190197 type:complete len:141 (+) Transcript_121754:64-486(+)